MQASADAGWKTRIFAVTALVSYNHPTVRPGPGHPERRLTCRPPKANTTMDYDDYDDFDDGPDDGELYDEDGDPIDPDDAWQHDELYDAWGDPVERADDGGSWSGSTDRDDEVLPSGYTRREYKEYGATDDDIEYWGFDQPDAPHPAAAGWVAWDMADQMDADAAEGCGFLLAVSFFSLLAGGLAVLAALAQPLG